MGRGLTTSVTGSGASIYSGFLAVIRIVEVPGIVAAQSLLFFVVVVMAVIIGKRK